MATHDNRTMDKENDASKASKNNHLTADTMNSRTRLQIATETSLVQRAALRTMDCTNGQRFVGKRQPLGTICCNNTRAQPLRNAKLGVTQDTSCTESLACAPTKPHILRSKKPAPEPFVAYCDEEEIVVDDDESSDAKAAQEDAKASSQEDTSKALKTDIFTELQLASPMTFDVYEDEEEAEKDVDVAASTALTNIDLVEYSTEIYSHLREIETRLCAKPYYMRKQPDITYNMRSILVDWLVEVADEYKLQTDTLYLAVAYVDRFLSTMSVLRNKLQLVGTASMFIASKYEEIYPPDIKEFVYITDDTYTKKQVLQMEQLMLKVLSFDLAVPTAYTFLQYTSKIAHLEQTVLHLSQYLCELTLLQGDPFLQFPPSKIACSAICIANHTLGKEIWANKLVDELGYSVDDLKPCINYLYKTYVNAPSYPQKAIREKYKASKYNSVSLLNPSESS